MVAATAKPTPYALLEAVKAYADELGPTPVTFQKGKGFKKCIGTYQHPDGRRLSKIFWLGHDEFFARRAASIVKALHHITTDEGETLWSPEALKVVPEFVQLIRQVRNITTDALRSYLETTGRAVPEMPPEVVATPGAPATIARQIALTLAKARENYLASVKPKVCIKNYNRQVTSLGILDEVIPPTTPMDRVNKIELERAVAHVRVRPVRQKTRKPMAVETVMTTIQHWRQFFNWLDGVEWEAPRRMDKVFAVHRYDLMTPAEMKEQAKGQKTFTFEELKVLYANANDRQRIYILMSLNFAYAQGEISNLLKEDVDLQASMIHCFRHKVRRHSVEGQWEIWPETKALLEKAMKSTPINPGNLALLTENGRPLVNDPADSDAIAQSWVRLMKRVNKEKEVVRPLSFKFVRKTASDAIRRISGLEEVQQLMLSQRSQTVAGKHYTGQRDFSRLFEPLRQFRQQLLDAGVFSG
jgi:integrase